MVFEAAAGESSATKETDAMKSYKLIKYPINDTSTIFK